VFHPADYSILNALVGRKRMGRAFSIHTACGHLGDAVGPVTIIALATTIGWQSGFVLCGLVGVVVAAWLWFGLDPGDFRPPPAASASDGGGSHASGVALLLSLPVITGLVFFFGLSLAGRGMSGFGVATLDALYGISLAEAGVALSCYLFASPAGVLLGGYVADRVERHDHVAVGCFLVAGACALLVGLLELPLFAIGALFATAGLASGMVAPSRDMLIRAVTPPGQMGKVFGFVSTGFNLAGIVGPLMFGYILDHANPRYVFFVIAALALFNVTTVIATGLQGRRRGHGNVDRQLG
ncbi:MAG: MFS transporter, partial [Gammaproteobacteria bacterium]